MYPTGVSLRRRLPSPENDNSFFPSESIHDEEDLKHNLPSGDDSVSTCSSPFTERLNDEASHDEADDDSSSCEDQSDCSESSKSSLESGEIEEDDESSLGENLIGRKVLVFPMPEDDSSLGSLDDDQSDRDEDEKLPSDDEEESSSSSEDDSTHDPDDHSETEKVSRIPRSFIVGKKYYGSKQPRSFDSDDMSHDGNSSVDSDESSSSSSEEGARGLGLALDDALSALSDESIDKDRSESGSFCGQEEDEVSSVFDTDDDSVSDHSFGVSNEKTLRTFQSELNQSNVSVFVSMEDELKQALNDNTNMNGNDNIGQFIENNRAPVRKDSISIEELNEIINNESSSSDSEIDFSDDEEESIPQYETNLTKDAKNESQHAKIKRQFSDGNLSSLDYLDHDSESSPKRFRSSSASSSSVENEEQDLSRQHFLVSDSGLPPLPWLSLGPSQTSREVMNNQSSPTLRPENEIFDKEYREEIEFDLSEELYFSNKSKAPNEYASEVIPLLTPPHQPEDDLQSDFCEWPSNLAVDAAMTEVALSVKPLSPQSLHNDQSTDQLHSVNAVSLDATDCSVSRTLSPPPNLSYDDQTGLTPRLRGISVYAVR